MCETGYVESLIGCKKIPDNNNCLDVSKEYVVSK